MYYTVDTLQASQSAVYQKKQTFWSVNKTGLKHPIIVSQSICDYLLVAH